MQGLSFRNYKAAFTLAEVLITLGIIGIVAAVTLPTLISKYQKDVTAEKLRTTYSIINNAAKLSELDNDEKLNWVFPITNSDVGPFVEKYYFPYFKGASLYNGGKYAISNLSGREIYPLLTLNYNSKTVILSNGVFVTFLWNTSHTRYQWIFVDINGLQKPNRIGRDVFVMEGKQSKYVTFYGAGNSINGLKNDGNNYTEDEAENNRGGFGCSKKNKYGYYSGYHCGALIEASGWKIPEDDDYPW